MEAAQTRPKFDLEKKVVLITGAAQGIGLAATQALLKNGARVSKCIIKAIKTSKVYCVIQYQVNMIDVDEKTGLEACTELQKKHSAKNVVFTRCDVTKPEELVSHTRN